ncbi:MAG: 50S ribosomal protein L1, partial [Nitrososphaerales archaeon]
MLSAESVRQLVQEARKKTVKRNFNQTFELILTFKEMNPKQPLNLNEVVFLPHPFEKRPKICVIASGDLALRARNSGADLVIDGEELDRLANQKREIRKIASNYDFF